MAIVRVDPSAPDPEVISRAADALRAGQLVAFPTETVYGLGGAALDEAAIARIYAAKRRPSQHPLIVHVSDAADARSLASDWPELAEQLSERFWPGPLTLVVRKRDIVPDLVTAGLPSVALRVPAHPVARALLAAAGFPIAAPSANRYQSVSPTTAAHVERSLGLDAIAWLLDGGACEVGIESTVIDLSGERPRLLRPGGLDAAVIETVTGPLERVGAIAEEQPRSSPGLAARHYAPTASLEWVERDRMSASGSERVGALLRGSGEPIGFACVLELPDEPIGYARLLYAALHTFDELGCTRVLVERLPRDPRWAAVQDRLDRASHSAGSGEPGSAS